MKGHSSALAGMLLCLQVVPGFIQFLQQIGRERHVHAGLLLHSSQTQTMKHTLSLLSLVLCNESYSLLQHVSHRASAPLLPPTHFQQLAHMANGEKSSALWIPTLLNKLQLRGQNSTHQPCPCFIAPWNGNNGCDLSLQRGDPNMQMLREPEIPGDRAQAGSTITPGTPHSHEALKQMLLSAAVNWVPPAMLPSCLGRQE